MVVVPVDYSRVWMIVVDPESVAVTFEADEGVLDCSSLAENLPRHSNHMGEVDNRYRGRREADSEDEVGKVHVVVAVQV